MTKNNAFKKAIRAYMETHSVTYTEARNILDQEYYLKGDGSITLIVGATGVGKTTALQELLSSQTLPTAVLTAYREELTSFRNNSFVDNLRSKNQLQELVSVKNYSQFAFDDLGQLLYSINGPEHILDVLPRKANLFLTLYSTPWFRAEQEEPVESILHRLDDLKFSKDKLSPRVKLIKRITLDPDYSFLGYQKNFQDRILVTDYHL